AMDNDYGVSPLMLLRLLWPLTIILPVVMALVVTGPLVLYPIARWRANKEKHVDPQLGIKFALGYFGLMAFQVLLFGVMFVLYTMLSKTSSDDKGPMYRFGFGMIVPAAIVLSAHVVALRRTNELQFPNLRRLYLGYNLVITGLLGFIALV